MNTVALNRLVWGGLGLLCVLFWTLALIGAASLFGEPECPSVWEAAKTPMAGPR